MIRKCFTMVMTLKRSIVTPKGAIISHVKYNIYFMEILW